MAKSLAVGVILLLALVFPMASHAQDSSRLDLTVSPVSLELTTEPGNIIRDRIRVHNNTNEPIDLAVNIKKLLPSDQGLGYILAEPDSEDEFVSWIHIETPSFTIAPNEWFNVPFTLIVPQHAAFGYYPVFVFNRAGQQEEKIVSSGTQQISGGIAVIAALRIHAPGTKVQAQLLDFKTSRFIYEWLPTDFSVTLYNTGNIHMKPRGNIFIHRGEGEDIGILEVNPELSTIIPNSTALFHSTWNDAFITREEDEHGKKKFSIHWENITRMRIGKYSARLLMVYDNGTRDSVIESTTEFWVFPYTVVLIGIIVLLTSFFCIRFLLRWYIRRLVKREEEMVYHKRFDE